MTLDVPLLPNCGLYQTSAPVPGHTDVPAGRLVYFHNHSDQGTSVILLPARNQHNKWHFHKQGHAVADVEYPGTLRPLRREGLYRLREHFHPNSEQVVSDNALVQLGYTVEAEPILFFPIAVEDSNSVRFPARGMKIDARIYGLLEPLDLRGPHKPKRAHLH